MLYGIKDSADFTVRKKSDNSVVLFANYAQTTSSEWSAEAVYARSKDTKAIRWDYNKEATLNVSMEIFDLKWMSILIGQDFAVGATEVYKREVLTADAGSTITLAETPLSGSLEVFTLEADSISNDVEQTLGTPATTPNTYSITGKVITLNATTAPLGKKIAVFYKYTSAITAKKLAFNAYKFPENYSIAMDTMVRNTDGVDSFVQFNFLNVKPQANFTITNNATEVTTLEITFDVFADPGTGDMAIYTII